MLSVVYLNDQMAGGRYRDIVLVAERLARGPYASKNNAVAQMVRQSPLFKDELAKMNSEVKRRPRKKRGAQ